MLNVFEYGVYITSIGMGGVFVVLSVLSLFMWLIGHLNTPNENKLNKNDKLSEKELFAVISAIYEYESEQNNVPIILISKAWKNAAKMEGLV